MKAPKLLFVAATLMEVQAFWDRFDCRETSGPGWCLFQAADGSSWACLVTGAGVFNTAAGLGACLGGLEFSPDMVVDVGIAGVFPGAGLGIGGLALAENDTYLHTGVGEEGELPFDLIPGLAGTRIGCYPLDGGALKSCRDALASAGMLNIPEGPFLTVSAITDSRQKAAALRAETPYLMESMEGAAAAHVCALYGVPMAQVRAGSNITGDRDKGAWDIPGACRALASACSAICKNFS